MIAAIAAPQVILGPRVALRVADPLRRRQLERELGAAVVREAEADVLLVVLPHGGRLPDDAASFDGPHLVLTDDRALAGDAAVAGVLPLASTLPRIRAALAAVAEGLTVRLPGTAGDASGFAPPETALRPLLTPRELEVLALVGEGNSNKTIARRLGISAHTVKYHLEAVYAKLAVRSRAEAVTRGLRHGLLVV